jgi:hypothetical protein
VTVDDDGLVHRDGERREHGQSHLLHALRETFALTGEEVEVLRELVL